MKELVYEITVDAPLEKVWNLLVDFDNYPDWNSMIAFKGNPAVGKKVPMRVSIHGRVITTPVKFLKMDENKKLAWIGGPAPLFTGEHYFILEKIDEKNCKLIQGEKFKGLLVPLMFPVLERPLRKLYEDTNEDVRRVFG